MEAARKTRDPAYLPEFGPWLAQASILVVDDEPGMRNCRNRCRFCWASFTVQYWQAFLLGIAVGQDWPQEYLLYFLHPGHRALCAGARGGVPREQVYNFTMHILTGMLALGLVANLLVKPLADRWFMSDEEVAGQVERGTSRSDRLVWYWQGHAQEYSDTVLTTITSLQQ